MLLTWLVFLLPLLINVRSDDQGRLNIDCGAVNNHTDEETGLKWVPDDRFISVGNKSIIQNPKLKAAVRSLRYFPDSAATKYCYVLPVMPLRRYLVRTTYYYGNYDGENRPPVFEQMVEGTLWSTVNSGWGYAMGLLTYYEIVIQTSRGKSLSLCLARTVGNPFISSIEIRALAPSVYNSTDFTKYALDTVARHSFGDSDPRVIRYPDDKYDRFWQPFQSAFPRISASKKVTVIGFWNYLPAKVIQTGLTTNGVEPMEIQWLNHTVTNATYYIVLYFNNIDTITPPRERIFNISVNDNSFYSDLNLTTSPWMIFTSSWTLSDNIKIKLTPVADSALGPIINAGELLQLIDLGGRTHTRDVITLNALKKSLINTPSDWEGDPCLPTGYSWTGIVCVTGNRTRVTTLNLTGFGISGSLSPSIANLTALTQIYLGSNKLSGPIPDLRSLKHLTTLDLEDNKLNGEIPESLEEISTLYELYLQNNELSGRVPQGLRNNPNLNLQVYPGNPLLEEQSLSPNISPPNSESPNYEGGKRVNIDVMMVLGLMLIYIIFIIK